MVMPRKKTELTRKIITDASGEGYKFCWDDCEKVKKVSQLPQTTLLKYLEIKVRDFNQCDVNDYEKIRRDYCVVNRALNRQEAFPPKFRPTIRTRIRFGTKPTRAQCLITNDHQIIDLEWLVLNDDPERPMAYRLPDNYRMMILSLRGNLNPQLSHAEAERFVGTAGPLHTKAFSMLRLDTDEQYMVRTFQLEEVRLRWRLLTARRQKVEELLRAKPRKKSKLDWPNAWLAGELSSHTFSAQDWYFLLTGEDIASSSITYARTRSRNYGDRIALPNPCTPASSTKNRRPQGPSSECRNGTIPHHREKQGKLDAISTPFRQKICKVCLFFMGLTAKYT
jgi:hypothetical protein